MEPQTLGSHLRVRVLRSAPSPPHILVSVLQQTAPDKYTRPWVHSRGVITHPAPTAHSPARAVKLALASPDGDGGYPGDARATVTYTMEPLPGGSHGFTTQLRVAMECECSAPCPVNMVHHAYYNLAGHASGKLVWDHHLEMPRAHFYTPVGANLVPTGEIREVDGTAVDFRRRKRIGDVKEEVEPRGGLDNNLVVRGKEEFEGNRGEIVLAGQVREKGPGLGAEISRARR